MNVYILDVFNSYRMPRYFISHTSYLILYTSYFIPHTSYLIPHKIMAKYSTLSEIQSEICAEKTSVLQVVEYYLGRIESTQHLNAYIEVFTEEAVKRAIELDKKYRHHPQSVGRLFGAVISLKDVICYKDHEVTAASKILRGFKSVFSATAVERLLAEDAIIIGRTNCDQFAMGSDNSNSIYGVVHNAADETRVAGGSSGGAAV